MRWQAVLVLAASVLYLLPGAASGYSFGEWASDYGYSPGALMPTEMRDAIGAGIDNLNGIGDYDWTATQKLWLNETQLTAIEADSLSGLTHLSYLSLYDNHISSIEAGGFNGLTNLTALMLSRNAISSLEAVDFSGLPNLTRLYLEHNQLSSIRAGDLESLSGLTWLSLYDNRISTIEASGFEGLSNLESLSLEYNQLSNIEAVDFSGLWNLTSLGLFNNHISVLDPGVFAGLPQLTWLGLSNNEITSIGANSFSGLWNLTALNLGGNQIADIEPGAFGELHRLEALFLDDNSALTVLNLDKLHLPNLQEFHVEYDPNLVKVSLRNAVLSQKSLETLLEGGTSFAGNPRTGFGELDGITQLDLSGMEFRFITDLSPIYVLDDLRELWLAHASNLSASDLDLLLDNLATIQGTSVEGVVYMAPTDFEVFNVEGGGLLSAWDAEPGHHVELVLPGDFNGDGVCDGADFLVWQRGESPNPHSAVDLAAWQADYGGTLLADSQTAVPEPPTVWLDSSFA